MKQTCHAHNVPINTAVTLVTGDQWLSRVQHGNATLIALREAAALLATDIEVVEEANSHVDTVIFDRHVQNAAITLCGQLLAVDSTRVFAVDLTTFVLESHAFERQMRHDVSVVGHAEGVGIQLVLVSLSEASVTNARSAEGELLDRELQESLDVQGEESAHSRAYACQTNKWQQFSRSV